MCQGHRVLSGTKFLFYFILLNNCVDTHAGKGCFQYPLGRDFCHWWWFITLKEWSWKKACLCLKVLLKSFLLSAANTSTLGTYLSFSFYLSAVLHQISHDFGLAGPSCHVQRCFSSLGNRSQGNLTAALKKPGLFSLHKVDDGGFFFFFK